MIWYLETLD
ncbi:unnamed protein product [Acanthoscelides obtectus]|uniref:Uncharacterized protein n=1 Tax=Acanthoscelides obtectus TaxID=200917 RepID=A0A9P0QF57_ACAOB|nr:unnamed protein product [Acanthoscelides obtectus]CAK1688939.1 hypothetical protein AOBTE_LOCUS36962 [Acanthoscelides obtectus]